MPHLAFLLTATLLAALIPPVQSGPVQALTGARLLDGSGSPPIDNAVIVVRGQRIVAAGAASTTAIPDGAERIDLAGRTIIPGMVNAHGHVGSTLGLRSGPELATDENVRRQLGLYARYGVTTVVSLGDEGEPGFRARGANDAPGLDRARVFVAGSAITATTAAEARAAVDAAAASKPDWIKIRVDDNLGTTTKMAPDVYAAVIGQAHARGLRAAAHIFYLADAKALLKAGVDYLAHSIRDADVDRELIDLMNARNACLSPTLMREVSTFVYESRPSFFDDPFFRREVDPAVISALEDPTRQAGVARSRSAQRYKQALEVARRNAKALRNAGVRLASGTDTGPPARFQGYFEHLELEELVKAGLTPDQALVAATGDAARCMGLGDSVGTIQPGRYADLVVLTADPTVDIRNTRNIESVWIGGRQMP